MKCWLIGVPFLALLACGERGGERSPNVQWVEQKPSVAQHFTVLRNGPRTRLIVFGTGGSTDTVADHLISADTIPSACAGCISTHRLAVLSTTYLPYMSTLGSAHRVVGAVHLDHVRDAEMLKRIARGTVTDIGTADGVDREAIVALAPDLVLGYPFGRTTGEGDIAGVPLVLVAEYLEPHPLGRAEWLKFFGALLGKEHEADSLYAGIARRYADVMAVADTIDRPKVLFGSQWNGQWWVPPGNSYMAQMIADAGGDYVFADLQGKENIAVDMETILARANDADAWGMIAEKPRHPVVDDFTGGDQRLVGLKAVRENNLFLGNTSRSDLFGQAIIEPDILLAELRVIMQPFPGITDPNGRRPKYFERLRDLIPPPPDPEHGQ